VKIDAIFHLGIGIFFFGVFLLAFLTNMFLLSILNLTCSFLYFVNFTLDFILKERKMSQERD